MGSELGFVCRCGINSLSFGLYAYVCLSCVHFLSVCKTYFFSENRSTNQSNRSVEKIAYSVDRIDRELKISADREVPGNEGPFSSLLQQNLRNPSFLPTTARLQHKTFLPPNLHFFGGTNRVVSVNAVC